jgi:hypothetical protein
MLERVTFREIFNVFPDGTLEPRVNIQVGGISFGPGVRFSRGASFAGIDFTLFIDRDIQIDRSDGNIQILGVF